MAAELPVPRLYNVASGDAGNTPAARSAKRPVSLLCAVERCCC